MPKQFTDAERARARSLYVHEGLSVKKIAEEIGASHGTVSEWKNRERWPEKGSGQSGNEVIATEAEMMAEKDKLIAELEAELSKAQDQLQDLDPTLYLTLYTSPGEVKAYYEDYYGADALRDTALAQLSKENHARMRRGLPARDYSEDERLIQSVIDQIADTRVKQRTSKRGKYKQRGIKMARANTNKPGVTLAHKPVESQIENEAGQAGTAIAKYKAKGWKILVPHLCQAHNCWDIALTDDRGALSLNGYCSQECRATDPYLNPTGDAGVSGVQAGVIYDPTREAGMPRPGMVVTSR